MDKTIIWTLHKDYGHHMTFLVNNKICKIKKKVSVLQAENLSFSSQKLFIPESWWFIFFQIRSRGKNLMLHEKYISFTFEIKLGSA